MNCSVLFSARSDAQVVRAFASGAVPVDLGFDSESSQTNDCKTVVHSCP